MKLFRQLLFHKTSLKETFLSTILIHQAIIFHFVIFIISHFPDVFSQLLLYPPHYGNLLLKGYILSIFIHSFTHFQSSLFIDYLCIPSPPIFSIIMSNGELYCVAKGRINVCFLPPTSSFRLSLFEKLLTIVTLTHIKAG